VEIILASGNEIRRYSVLTRASAGLCCTKTGHVTGPNSTLGRWRPLPNFVGHSSTRSKNSGKNQKNFTRALCRFLTFLHSVGIGLLSVSSHLCLSPFISYPLVFILSLNMTWLSFSWLWFDLILFFLYWWWYWLTVTFTTSCVQQVCSLGLDGLVSRRSRGIHLRRLVLVWRKAW